MRTEFFANRPPVDNEGIKPDSFPVLWLVQTESRWDRPSSIFYKASPDHAWLEFRTTDVMRYEIEQASKIVREKLDLMIKELR